MKLLLAAVAATTVAAEVVHERAALPVGWRDTAMSMSGDVVLASDEFTFTVVLPNQNMDELRTFVEQISDPDSATYGQSMTNDEVMQFTKPSAEHQKTVTEWLESSDCTYEATTATNSQYDVTCSVSAAEQLLSTRIGHVVNSHTKQGVVRATQAYSLPDDVDSAVGAIFGVHGLPIPQREALGAAPGTPADVTPAVLYASYDIKGVTPKGTTTNRMAVAEFQGQNEKDSDIVAFFKDYVKDAQEGDDKVYKFVGDKDQQQAGVEASLDIQYIMGVAPHIKAEFWLYDPSDFCADLGKWSGEILKESDSGPRVHSVSYGWQGDLSQLQCTKDKYSIVDENFVKIAATRSTIIFASGDSGSGYAPPQPDCSSQKKDTANKGTVSQTLSVPNAMECCEISAEYGAQGYTFTPGGSGTPGATCVGTDIGTKNKAYTGKALRTLTFSASDPGICCEIARQNTGHSYHFSVVPNPDGTTANCSLYSAASATKTVKGAYSGVPASPSPGKCEAFSTVTGSESKVNATSGTTAAPSTVKLYPSWPASSPYVTAVGATRFVDQTVGQPEMATDQFGSGGGFSDMFDQTHASYQTEAVKAYTSNPPKDPHYPPAGSFDPNGRATPDVSALGEGYQVYVDGTVNAVGGTSASAPAFAGMIALLNEALEQAGKPSLGFANPFLYKNADCFTDVTRGTNAIGRGTGPIKYGFNATKGWDPATGLGSPVFSKLLAAALK